MNDLESKIYMKKFLIDNINEEFDINNIMKIDDTHYMVTIEVKNITYPSDILQSDTLLRDVLVESIKYNIFVREARFTELLDN